MCTGLPGVFRDVPVPALLPDSMPDYDIEPVLFSAPGTRSVAPLDTISDYDTEIVVFTE